MFKVGLTGGIGSGKTTVANIFNSFGIPVYNSDDRAKWLMNNNEELKVCLVDDFGPEVFNDEDLNTAYLSELVFRDEKKTTYS